MKVKRWFDQDETKQDDRRKKVAAQARRAMSMKKSQSVDRG